MLVKCVVVGIDSWVVFFNWLVEVVSDLVVWEKLLKEFGWLV